MLSDPAAAALFTLPTLGVIWLGAFLGAVASGGAGFAFVVVASSIWLHVLDPVRAAVLNLGCSLLLQLWTIWPMRHYIEGSRLWPFLVGGLLGIPLGVQLLAHTNPGILKTALGALIAAFGAYILAAPRLPVIAAGGRAADAAVAFGGGILGGLGGYSGVLPTIWTQLRGWPKDIARGVYQPFILMAQFVTLILLGVVALDRTAVLLFVAVLPPLAAGALLGWNIYGRLDDRRFRQMLAILLVSSGIALIF
ncbi:MAG TPA: sulfite exporter TauE/SafE family protein [Xanthobacteraceae bacterium]|nr:sulfite exporter TauE/SafE family protein [Xanthobacteraceae bacterium]